MSEQTMAGDWTKLRLGDVCSKIGSGSTPRGGNSVYRDDGVSLIRSQNILNERFSREGLAFIDDDLAEQLKGVTVAEGDVLLNITGDSVARVCQAPADVLPARVNQHVAIIRPDSSILDPKYLRYYLVNPAMQQELLAMAGAGATRNALTKGMIEQLEVVAPEEVDDQRAISHILGTLDDKIELNRRMNETLEALARAIFKSWFVDFDPARAKARELIAEGILQIGDGYRAKNEELGVEGVPFIRAGELNNGFDTANADRLKPDRIPAAKGKQSNVGDIAFTSKGTVGRFARVGEHTEPFVYSPQICFWRSLRPDVIHPAILYCWMQSGEFVSQIDGVAGQTDMAPYVSLRDQKAMEVPRFHESQTQVGEMIGPLLHLIAENQAESRSLAKLRDTLLPKLLSRELPTAQGGH